MNKEKFLNHKTDISGDVRAFFNNFKPSERVPLKDWPEEDYPAPGDPDETVKIGETWINTPTNSPARHEARRRSLLNFMLADMNGFEGRMIMFWLNHFGVSEAKVTHSQQLWWWYKLIRDHSVGNFKEMIERVTTSPAMLVFLDGATSVKDSPNANYARELFELFTLKKGNGYTEEDIKEAARALTGWKIDEFGMSYFEFSQWDPENKQVFGLQVRNDTDLINILFQERGGRIAVFIALKLVRYFTGSGNSELVKDVADALFFKKWSIKEALITLFTHDEFYNPDYMVMKSPFDLIKSAAQSIGFPNDVRYYQTYKLLRERMKEMGQDLLNTPDVSGYAAYKTAPDYHRLWYNEVTAVLRSTFCSDIFDQWKFTMDTDYFLNPIQNLPYSQDPDFTVSMAVNFLIPFEWSIDRLNQLKVETILSGQAENRYWSDAVEKFIDNRTEENRSVIQQRLRALYQAILSHIEFQVQ